MTMQYILTTAWDDGIADLTKRLMEELSQKRRVLWLVSGGSNIPASVQVMETIPDELSRHLSVSLADERYGEPGHAESNWSGLMQAGFDAKRARLLPVLDGLDFQETIDHYVELITRAFAGNETVIAQLGIGADGHIAGILPGSPAATATGLVAGYDAPPLKRLTLTFPALKHVSAAYAFAFGKPVLKTLKTKSLPLADQPAQILKELPEAYLYNDQVGDYA